MSRKRKFWVFTGVMFAVVILASVIHHYQLRLAVEKYIAERKAAGEPMDLAAVIPPPILPEKNGAEIFRRASALISSDQTLSWSNYVSGMQMVAPGKAMVRWQQADIRDSDGTNSWTVITTAVAQNQESFDLLRQIVDKPDFDFQIQYAGGVADMTFTNFYLSESKRAVQRLATAALCDLHRGDTVSAVKNVRAMLALTKAMQDERFAISELVRMALAQITLSVNWELLQCPNLTDTQLAELQHDWMNLDFVESMGNALAMERASGEISLSNWRKSNFELNRYFEQFEEARKGLGMSEETSMLWCKTKRPFQIFLWRNWWSYPDELRSLKGYDVLITSLRRAQTNGCFTGVLQYQNEQLDELGINKITDDFLALFTEKTDFHSMLSQSIAGLSGVTRKVLQAEVAEQMTVTAIALNRYQRKHGEFPPVLVSLVPEFLAAVPRDPADGQPLRYRPAADGTFLLYSVGENDKDDGGDPSLEPGASPHGFTWLNNRALDWVWPRPATAAEVQDFYEHPSK
jgi:hypothetical protein